MFRKNVLVYQSKKKEDWEKAQQLLASAGIEHHAWFVEEAGAAGCGSKIDPRKIMRRIEIPKEIYRIEVDRQDGKKAEDTLRGNVLPVISYGL